MTRPNRNLNWSLLAAVLLVGGTAAAQTAQTAQQTGQTSGTPAPPTVTAPAPPALLWDGQRLTLRLSFRPGDPSGPAYPPRTEFSRTQPAYYPPLGAGGTARLSVTTRLPRAALLLRARSLPGVRGSSLPVDRLEYRVGAGPWLRAGPLQVVALVPEGGQANYDLSFRLRLEGDETAGDSQVLLTWTLEAQ